MCRENNSFPQFHYDTLTWPEQQVWPWMWCLNAAETIIGYRREPKSVGCVDGFHTFHHTEWKDLQNGYTWSGERLTKKQTTSMPDHLWPERWKICQTQRNAEKKSGLSKNRNLTTPESWEVFISLIRRMRSSRKPWKTRGKSWKFRCQHPCLARLGEASTERLTCSASGIRKTKYACIVEADESTRKRLEGTLHKRSCKPQCREKESSTEPRYQMRKQQWTKNGKTQKKIHWAITRLCTSFFLCLKQWKYQMRQKQWTKNGKNFEKFPAWQLTKVRNKKKEAIDEVMKEGKMVRH